MPRPLPSAPSKPLAYALLLVSMLLWGSAFSGIRFVLRVLDPFTLTAMRMVFGSATLLAVGAAMGTPLPKRQDLPEIAGAGLLGFTIYHMALNYGLQSITAGQGSFIISTIPIWTSLLAAQFLGERITGRTWIGMLLGLSGVAYMSLEPGKMSVSSGSLFVLISAVSAGGNIILQKRLLERYRALDATVYATSAGTLPLLLVVPFGWHALTHMGMTAWLVTIYLGVVPIALGYLLNTMALSALDANRASQMLLLVPIIASLVAWATLGEQPGTKLLIGGPLILVGVLLGNWRKRGARANRAMPKDA